MAQTPCAHGRSCKRSQKPGSAGKIIQLLKLGVRKPPAKCRDAPACQPWVRSPAAQLGLGSGEGAAPACLHPGLGSAASGGIQGKNHPGTPRGCSSPHEGFLGSCQITTLSSQCSVLAFSRGCLVPPTSQPTRRLLGSGSCVPQGVQAVPVGLGHSGMMDARAMHRGGVTLAEWTVRGPFF